MDSFYIHFLAEERVIYRGNCLSLTLPITDGLLGIQAHHSNMIAAVVPGPMKLVTENDGVITAKLGSGLVKAENNDVLLLVESALLPGEETVAEISRAEETAREAEMSKKARLEYHSAQATLIRTTKQLKKKRGHGNEK